MIFATGFIAAVSAGLVMLMPDLSMSMTIFFIAMAICFIKKPGVALLIAGVSLILSVVYISMFSEFASSRIATWLDPFSDPLHHGWHTIQSLYNIAAGGVFGVGLGVGSEYQMKHVPNIESGYILSGISYQLGLVGAVLILVLLSLIAIRAASIASKSKDSFAFYLAAGISAKFAVSIILNTLIVVNLIPSANFGGLPFIAFSGSSMILDFICVGIVLNISKYSMGVKSLSLVARR